MRRATLLGAVFAADIRERILGNGNPRVSPLLRAIVHQPVLADVEISCASPALPVVRYAIGNLVLELVQPRVALLRQMPNPVEDIPFQLAEWLELTTTVMDDTDGRTEPKFVSPRGNDKGVFGILDRRADH